MGSQTPKFAIPYPVGTDRVADGDNAMQAIAERVEAVLLAPVAGVAIAYSANVIDAFEGTKVWRTGGTCVLRMAFKVTAAFAGNAVLMTTPAGYRPPDTFRALAWDFTAGAWAVGSFVPMTIPSSGGVWCDAPLPINHTIVGSLIYPMA